MRGTKRVGHTWIPLNLDLGGLAWTYRADGQPSAFVQPNGNTTALDYDNLGHLTSKDTTASGPTNRALYDWTYNRAGQILTEASTIIGDPDNGTLTYAYDPLGRLTGSTVSATTTAYAWDKVPNRTSVQVGGGTAATTAYDDANRPVSGATPTAAYASDADGRLLARPGQTLGWDQLGRLASVKNASGTTTLATYSYDPLDRLRTADDGVNRIRFRYVGLTTSAAQWLDDVAGTVTSKIGTGWSGERLLDWTGSGSNIRIYGENAHHDVTWLSSSSGSVSQALRYDPWGVPRSTPPVGYSPFRFQGSWYDGASDLSWVVTRWYAPTLGRFVSEDSLLGRAEDPPSRHLYAYGSGEPVGRWDPDGQAACRYDPEDCAAIEKAKKDKEAAAKAAANAAAARHRARQTAIKNATVRAMQRYDRVLSYMVEQMVKNAKGDRFGHWSYGHLNCIPQGPCSAVRFTTPLDDANNAAVLAKFGLLVRQGGDWDHKGPLRSKYSKDRVHAFYTPVRDDRVPERIYYDIWSNIHYGYVGRSHGIPSGILFTAPNIADGINTKADNLSVNIGMDLWDRAKLRLQRADLHKAVLSHMSQYRSFHGKDRVVISGYFGWYEN